MQIGIPRELKNNEYRVALTPAGVRELAGAGHHVLVEAGAGAGSAIADEDYRKVGAEIVPDASEVWQRAELLVKVKEPIASEYRYLRPDLVLFAYLHLAADRPCTDALLASGVTAIAYETVQLADGSLPLLAPMSEVAGRLAPQVGAYHLMRSAGGRGVLPGGVPGVRPAAVTVLGGGVAGTHAAQVAAGMGAQVTVVERNPVRLRELDLQFGGRITTLASSAHAVEESVLGADLVIGSVLIPGARAPHLVTSAMVEQMRSGAVLVDIAIDQGGCFADSHPTSHDEPTFTVGHTQFYCVANMPGAVPATSTQALTNATLPYVEQLAGLGWQQAIEGSAPLARGVNVHAGELVNPAVAQAHALPLARPTH